MDKNIPVITIEEFLSSNCNKKLAFMDIKEEAKDTVYGIANMSFPDHTLKCRVPKKMIKEFGCEEIRVQMHFLWLTRYNGYDYSGLVIDKSDYNFYFVNYDDDSYYVSFSRVTMQQMFALANKYNPFLNDIIKIASTDRKKLLDYQIYSGLSDKFYYMEMPFEDKMVLCGVGLNDNSMIAVGWFGKLAYKDFYVAYAECDLGTYEQIKKETCSLYERARLMEKNQHRFSCYKAVFDKRRNYSNLLKIVKANQTQPFGSGNVVAFSASSNGTQMKEYAGPAYRWMEDFIMECKKTFDSVN